jgi:glycogen debranching enzyme
VTSTADVETLTHALTEYLKSLDFWQYYVLDVKAERERIKEALSMGKITPWDGPNVAGKTTVEHFKILKDLGKIDGYRGLTGRFSTKVDGSVAAGFVKAAFPEVSSIDALADRWIEVVDVVNVSLYEEWGEDTKVALENIKNRLKYTRLDDHGPKLGLISAKCVLFHLTSSFADNMQVPSRGALLYSPA